MMKPTVKKIEEKDIGTLVKKSNLFLTLNPNKKFMDERYLNNFCKVAFGEKIYEFCVLKDGKKGNVVELDLMSNLVRPVDIEWCLERGPVKDIPHVHALLKFQVKKGYVHIDLPKFRDYLREKIGNSYFDSKAIGEKSGFENYIRKGSGQKPKK